MRSLKFLAAALTLATAAAPAIAGEAPVGQPASQPMVRTKLSLPTGAVGETAAQPVRYVLPLSKFVATPGPLVLHDSAANSRIAIPLSGRLHAKTIQLNLVFTNSIALDPQTSVMNVRFNETTLAQIRLDPKSPSGSAVINLPIELVRPGYNTLSLGLSQHNGLDCEDPEAPELWTEINTAESSLTIDGEYSNAQLRLADLNEIFTPGIGGARRLAMVTPPLEKDAAMLEAGGLVAQAVALRTQYETVDLRPVTLAAPAEGWVLDDQAIIGTREQIAGLLEPGEADKITGPYVSLRSLDKRQVRLVVSGRTPQDVLLAARALTYMDMPFADALDASVRGIKAPTATARGVQPERVYSFEELGLATTTVAGFGTQKMTLTLPMPPDLYAPEQATLTMLLDLNYGAGFGLGSTINIDVNGKFLQGVNMTASDGSSFRNYAIPVPLRDLVGGSNQINFSVIMRPVRGDRCAGASGRHLALTLFGTSSIEIPPAARVAAQPDLDLMVRTGFPYSEATTTPTTVWMPSANLAGASWALVGRLAQVSGAALPRLQYAVGGEPPRGAAILVGEARSLPPRVFANAVQAFGETHRVPYGSFASPKGVEAPGFWAKVFPWVAQAADAERKPTQKLPAGTIEQVNTLGDNIVFTAVRAEGAANGTVTVLTADTREQLSGAVQQLISPEFWGQARGDFMLWRGKPDTVTTMRLSPQFQSADAPRIMNLRFYISQHPWWWLGSCVFVLMALSGLTVWLLARRRRNG